MTGAASAWLVLKVQDSPVRPSGLQRRPVVHLSVPKKIVPLATRRNRLKRLLREALRGHSLEHGKLYHFRLRRNPVDPTLAQVKTLVKDLIQPHV